MNFARTVHFTSLLLVFCCFNLNASKHIENFEDDIDFSNQIAVPETNKFAHISVKHRRKERATNDVCKIEDLKDLNLRKLNAEADKSADCAKVAAEVFQQKFANKFVTIERDPDPYTFSYKLTNSDIVISGLQAGTQTIGNFGHLIQNLTVDIEVDLTNCEPIRVNETIDLLKAIDAHCRESLVDFELLYAGCEVNNVFNQIHGPFEHVKSLSLDLYNMNEQTEDRKLNAIFPNVRHLKMEFHHLKDSSFIDCNLPKLEKLSINDGKIYESNKHMFIDLLKNNPQIKDLSLLSPTPEAIQHVQTYLTDLHELTINIKPQEISRSKLQDETEVNQYLDFLINYPKLQNLAVGSGLNKAHLSKLVGKFPKLSQAFFVFDDDVRADNIIEFVKQSQSLNKLTFILNNVEHFHEIEKQLKSELSEDFNFIVDNGDKKPVASLTIDRKIPIVSAACHCNSVVFTTFVMFAIAYANRFFFL